MNAKRIGRIRNARNLDELLAELKATDEQGLEMDQLMTELPTFGGEAPADTTGIWSWDAERLLVGTCRDDYRLVLRAAVNLGRRGGSVTSLAKAAAARANGEKGGRPQKGGPDVTWYRVEEGQMVQKSYGTDYEGTIYRRSFDSSDRTTTYEEADASELRTEWVRGTVPEIARSAWRPWKAKR